MKNIHFNDCHVRIQISLMVSALAESHLASINPPEQSHCAIQAWRNWKPECSRIFPGAYVHLVAMVRQYLRTASTPCRSSFENTGAKTSSYLAEFNRRKQVGRS
jgi:hypothetical protein